MNKKIVFDIDGTLFDYDNKPREEIINIMRFFNMMGGWDIYCHSGGGPAYCKQRLLELGLAEEMAITITPKGSPDYEFDVAIDDMDLEKDCLLAKEQGKKNYIKAKYYIKV